MAGKPNRTRYEAIPPYTTKDGSTIRELMHPDHTAVRNLSVAEAAVLPGQVTLPHTHQSSEEVYHILAGQGRITLGGDLFDVAAGDTVVIPPGTIHTIANTGSAALRILCCCAPPYRHDDTSLAGALNQPQPEE
ncbi:MAG: cupin domain-containing protein [Thermodesulfobacteriota bacterium]